MAGLVFTLACCGATTRADAPKTDPSSAQLTDESSTLSVAPLDHIDYPLDRPSWIEEHRVPTPPSDGADLLISVGSGPAASPEAASEMMDVMARGAVENYLEQIAQDGPEVIPAERFDVDMDWVRDELISRRYEGTVGMGDDVQYESVCLLRISDEQQQKLSRSIQNYQLEGRLSTVGAIALIGFVGLLSGSVGLGWLASRQRPRAAA